ncbi:MAG: MoxR family ATPase, partial [Rhodospirillales bacterium]
MNSHLPENVPQVINLLRKEGYIADESIATAIFLSLKLGRPLFLEGEAGVGKTEVAKVLASSLGRQLIRLQCYEGLDIASAVYEWNYQAQMIQIRLAEAGGNSTQKNLEQDIFSKKFLIERPILQALRPQPEGPPILLVDELDRA